MHNGLHSTWASITTLYEKPRIALANRPEVLKVAGHSSIGSSKLVLVQKRVVCTFIARAIARIVTELSQHQVRQKEAAISWMHGACLIASYYDRKAQGFGHV